MHTHIDFFIFKIYLYLFTYVCKSVRKPVGKLWLVKAGLFCIYVHLNPVHEPLAKNHMTYVNSRRENFILFLCPQKEEN